MVGGEGQSPSGNNKEFGLRAQVVYDYKAAGNDEITYDLIDLIENVEKIDEGR